MSISKRKFEVWTGISILLMIMFLLFLIYPLFGLMIQSVVMEDGSFSLKQFVKFFSQPYYTNTIINSFKVTLSTTILSLVLGIPMAYFYSFYRIKGARGIFVLSVLSCMSAPFIGAYAWIMLLGRNGSITNFLDDVLGIEIGSIYGFSGILLVQSLKFFPLVFIYMNGAFKNIDNTLIEASANMGCVGVNRLFKIILALSMPTILAAGLLVFMRAFADFGTPMLLGEGYLTFPILIYKQYVGEIGTDYSFAAAISVIAIVITAVVFFIQKYATSRFQFSINALHPIEKKEAKGILGIFMHLYSYVLVGIAFLPQIYIIYLSFRNCTGARFREGYSFNNYITAANRALGRATWNTFFISVVSLTVIVVLSVLIAYLVVRRSSYLNHTIDTVSMIPYILPGAVVGIALLTTFTSGWLHLNGTYMIIILAVVIRRLPYCTRSSTASLMQIPLSIEEAAIILGASKLKTLVKVTMPMMSNGILSGAILSWVAIITEVSSSILLYNNQTITLTMSTYVSITRGQYGVATVFSTILTVVTAISLLIYLSVSETDDIKL